MFISSDAAKRRLEDDRNRLRSDAPALDLPDVPETVDVPDGAEEQDQEQDDTDFSLDSPLLDLAHLDSVINKTTTKQGRYTNKLEPQVAIAQTSDVLGPSAAGALFGLSAQQSGRYPDGYTNGRDEAIKRKKPALQERIDQYREVLCAKAAGRLDSALTQLTDTKLEGVKRATNLSKIARDMATIVDKVSPHKEGGQGSVHFHIYRPEQESMSAYKMVKVGSTVDVVGEAVAREQKARDDARAEGK